MFWTRSRLSVHRQRVAGCLAVLWLVSHGWLPVLAQISALAATSGHEHAPYATEEARTLAVARPGTNRECPVTHAVVCLCAALAKAMPSAGAPVAVATRVARGRRGRFPSGRPPRPVPGRSFDARAPPDSD
jgi:hypothetical protein